MLQFPQVPWLCHDQNSHYVHAKFCLVEELQSLLHISFPSSIFVILHLGEHIRGLQRGLYQGDQGGNTEAFIEECKLRCFPTKYLKKVLRLPSSEMSKLKYR